MQAHLHFRLATSLAFYGLQKWLGERAELSAKRESTLSFMVIASRSAKHFHQSDDRSERLIKADLLVGPGE